jgi:hypothetical protein
LHLGTGTGQFGPAIQLTNIGTNVKNFIGPGVLPSGTAPSVWWDNNDGNGYALKSDGGTGISGSPLSSGVSWSTCTSVFAAPGFYSNGSIIIICKGNTLNNYSLSSTGAATFLVTWGSSWDASYPGDNVFGAGDFSVNGVGDLFGLSAAGGLNIYSGNGTGGAAAAVTEGSGYVNNRFTGGFDLDGDGKTDLVRFYTQTNTLTILKGLGNGAIGSTITVN